jgi:hypothetical protein
VLEDMSPEEMSHIVAVSQRVSGPASESALEDCIRTIRSEHQAASVASEDDLLKLREQLQKRKGKKI